MSNRSEHRLDWQVWSKRLALIWAMVVALLVAHNVYLWGVQKIAPDTDIMALLPAQQRDPVLQQAFTHMVDAAQQRVIVLVGANDWQQAKAAADAYGAVIAKHADVLSMASAIADQDQTQALALAQQNHLSLLTAAQQKALREQPTSHWVETALQQLYSPFSGPKLGAWQDDPFGLLSGWVQARAQETPVRPRDGHLFVEYQGRPYVLLMMTLQHPAYSMATQQTVLPLLAHASSAATQVSPQAEVISAGVVLHAGAASMQASSEMSTIGIGSLIGVILLMWLTFGSLRPIALIVFSIVVGCLAAFSLCWLIFGKVHLLTLVFGASLIGVAQDYGIYFLCSRVGADKSLSSLQLLRQLMPGLSLTLTAALIGYIGLVLTPFPGLQQMAIFSVIGLSFAWLTVVFCFPALIQASTLKCSRFANWFGATRRHWPLCGANRATFITVILFAVLMVTGLMRLQVNDDIRSLQTPPKKLLDDQIKLSKILDAPTPVQFYLVRGATEELVLQREEALTQRLDGLIAKHIISGYQAMSNWTPSLRTQSANRALVEQELLSDDGALNSLAKQLGEDTSWIDAIRKRALAVPALALTPDNFLATPAAEPSRHLWLGKVQSENGSTYASIVALRAIDSYANLPLLKQSAAHLDGVQWVDKVSEISSVLGHYRQYMGWVLLAAYVAIYLLLFTRYRFAAWRVVISPMLASLTVLALLGWLSQPLQLFHVLALMLILGLGVDYGIFLQEPGEGRYRSAKFAWLTVGLSALSALLSFGLLALSGTPPLHAFGFTMLVGIAVVWLIAPCFGRGALA